MPLNLLPIFSWINADASYNATYQWVRGSDLEDGTSLGNTITTNRNLNLNSTLNLEKLYNMVPFLKAANDKFNKEPSRNELNKRRQDKQKQKEAEKKQKEAEAKKKAEAENSDTIDGKDAKGTNSKADNKADRKAQKQKAELPKNKKTYEKEVTLKADTTFTLQHGKNTKRITVTAKTEDGKAFDLKYKKVDGNKILIKNKVDSALNIKVSVTPKEPLEDKGWYKTAQAIARVMMMVRSIGISYRNQYSMALPGFMPTVGDAFGQTKGTGIMSPGLDFAFGFVGDSYIEKARENNWLLMSDSVATPANTNKTEDLQLKMTLEPVKNFKIDLNASRTRTKAKSIQYMYQGNPTTESGTLTMTTISLKSAFEGTGNANNGYHSKSFETFCNSLPAFQQRVEERYRGTVYPNGSSLAGQTYDAANGGVNIYSGDVMIPAFLAAYTSMPGNSLDIFPALSRLLPNWTVRYSGLGKLPWFSDHFKSVNINHSYKSIFAIGSYSSYSTFMEVMGDNIGFVSDATTGNPVPSSMFNVSTVSINEAFSPLLGIDVTLHNNLTCKLEYRSTRVLSLSMTSIQINEATSHDWVLGAGYKVNNFNLFGGRNHRLVKGGNGKRNQQEEKASTAKSKKGGVNHDLNLRLDLSLRKQATIIRDIASLNSSASNGNNAFKLSFSADYTLSRLLTMSFYYDRQTNTPLLSSSSYPTTTQDFGLSIKFSLTR